MIRPIEIQCDIFGILDLGNYFNLNLNTLKKSRSSYVLLRMETMKTLIS